MPSFNAYALEELFMGKKYKRLFERIEVGGKASYAQIRSDYKELEFRKDYRVAGIDGDKITLEGVDGEFDIHEFFWAPEEYYTSDKFKRGDRVIIKNGQHAGKHGKIDLTGNYYGHDEWKCMIIVDGHGAVGLFSEKDIEKELKKEE